MVSGFFKKRPSTFRKQDQAVIGRRKAGNIRQRELSIIPSKIIEKKVKILKKQLLVGSSN